MNFFPKCTLFTEFSPLAEKYTSDPMLISENISRGYLAAFIA